MEVAAASAGSSLVWGGFLFLAFGTGEGQQPRGFAESVDSVLGHKDKPPDKGEGFVSVLQR